MNPNAEQSGSDSPPIYWSARRALLGTVALAGLFFILALVAFGQASASAAVIAATVTLASCLLVLTYQDLRSLILPDVVTLPLLGLGVAWSGLWGVGLLQAALGAGLAYGLIYGLEMYWRRVRGRDGIGLGDAKLFAAGGTWLGVFALPIVLLIASGAALLVILTVAIMLRRREEMHKIPFGPFLSLGIWCAWLMTIQTV